MRFLASLVVATVMLVAGPAAAQAAWTSYKSADYGFSVDVTAQPELSNPTADDVAATQFTVAGEGEAFVISIVDIPDSEPLGPNDLDLFLTGVVQGAEGHEVSRTKTTVSGKEARQVVMTFDGGAAATGVAVIRGRRAYLALAVRADGVDPAAGQRFLRSFRLLD